MNSKYNFFETGLEAIGNFPDHVPFLSLGQTVFWDEPLKVGVMNKILTRYPNKKWIAAIHDTDYFSKWSNCNKEKGVYLVEHNDRSTADIWVSAAEFAALFGSETVLEEEEYQYYGAKTDKINKYDPSFMESCTAAWYWKGLALVDNEERPIIANIPLHNVFPTLLKGIDWALDTTYQMIDNDDDDEESYQMVRKIREQLYDAAQAEESFTLSEYYQKLLSYFQDLLSETEVQSQINTSLDLMRFNLETCHQDRFALLDLFLNPATRQGSLDAYNQAIRDTGIYELNRFGKGAIPFEVVIPNKGRGTLCLSEKQLKIKELEGYVINLKKPITNRNELAEVIVSEWGEGCALIGKAVILISMLSMEFILVLHYQASKYIEYTKEFHKILKQQEHVCKCYPLLRIKYDTWKALSDIDNRFCLPPILAQAFGKEKITFNQFYSLWQDSKQEQQDILEDLKEIDSTGELIRYFAKLYQDPWIEWALEYEIASSKFDELQNELSKIREEKEELLSQIRNLETIRGQLEEESGEHWRKYILDQEPEPKHLEFRDKIRSRIEDCNEKIDYLETKWEILQEKQEELVETPKYKKAQQFRIEVELKAEKKRIEMIRKGLIIIKGLEASNLRPCSWWFPIVDPTGKWYKNTINEAKLMLELI